MGMPEEIERLRAEVERDTAVEASAATLLSQLSELIRNTQGDPAAVAALADMVKANADALAAAVAANTPSA